MLRMISTEKSAAQQEYLEITYPTALSHVFGIEHFGRLAIDSDANPVIVNNLYIEIASPVGYYGPSHATNFPAAQEFWNNGSEVMMGRYIHQKNSSGANFPFSTYSEWLNAQPIPEPVLDRNTGLAFTQRIFHPPLRTGTVPQGLLRPSGNEVLIVAGSFLEYAKIASEIRSNRHLGKAEAIGAVAAGLASRIE
jgi:hypothetical protein